MNCIDAALVIHAGVDDYTTRPGMPGTETRAA